MGHQALVAVSRNHEMQVGRAPWVAIECLEHYADRAVVGNWIGLGYDGAEPVGALIVSLQHRTALVLGQLRVLYVVEALGIGLPDVDFSVGHGFALGAADGATDVPRSAGHAVADVIAQGVTRRIFDMEGAKHRGLGATLGLLVVLRDDEGREPEGVGQQDEFLAGGGADLPGRRQELDALEPLFFGQVDVTGKRMHAEPGWSSPDAGDGFQYRHDGPEPLG